MTEHPDQFGAALSQDDPAFGAPSDEENPGDHRPDEQTAGMSEDTGTVYDATGETETTPHDEVPTEEDLDGPNAGTSATTDE
jgi:hypothetical protein